MNNYPATNTSITAGAYKVEVSDISAGVEGVQLYQVNTVPSQTGGLDMSKINSPYFGVFLATISGAGSFTAKGFLSNQQTCNGLSRLDNSRPIWNKVTLPLIGEVQRGEYILSEGALATFDLGPDKVVCDQPNFVLSTMLNEPSFIYLWNTGEKTPFITVTQSGLYSVTVTSPCGNRSDQVRVDFFQKPV
ncbi:MAG: hypothetical protein ACKO96_01720, partial [Flammeovirgaceae bacterium]